VDYTPAASEHLAITGQPSAATASPQLRKGHRYRASFRIRFKTMSTHLPAGIFLLQGILRVPEERRIAANTIEIFRKIRSYFRRPGQANDSSSGSCMPEISGGVAKLRETSQAIRWVISHRRFFANPDG